MRVTLEVVYHEGGRWQVSMPDRRYPETLTTSSCATLKGLLECIEDALLLRSFPVPRQEERVG